VNSELLSGLLFAARRRRRRDAMQLAVYATGILSVLLSLSVTFVICGKTAQHIVNIYIVNTMFYTVNLPHLYLAPRWE